MQEHAGEGCEQHEETQLDRYRPDGVALPKGRERGRVGLQDPVAENGVCNAAKERHGADGRDDRGNPSDGYQHAIEQSGERAGGESDRDHERSLSPRCRNEAHGHRGQSDDGGDGNVDFPGDDQQGQRQGDHSTLGEVERRIRQCVGIEEVGRDGAEEDEFGHHRQGEHGFPPHQCVPGTLHRMRSSRMARLATG